jgi:hypothetical protein
MAFCSTCQAREGHPHLMDGHLDSARSKIRTRAHPRRSEPPHRASRLHQPSGNAESTMGTMESEGWRANVAELRASSRKRWSLLARSGLGPGMMLQMYPTSTCRFWKVDSYRIRHVFTLGTPLTPV